MLYLLLEYHARLGWTYFESSSSMKYSTCLVRNVYNLLKYQNQVLMNPPITVDFSLLMCQHEEAHGPTFQYYARHIFGHQSCIHHLHTRRHSRLSDDLPLELMLANCISFTWWLPSMIGPHSSHLDSSYLATEEWCDTDVYRSVCSDNNRRATCERRDSPLGC